MPWNPLPRIAFAVASYPFAATSPADLPLEIGDELYIIEETQDGGWLRGYLVAPPSLLAGLTSVKGQTLEARVFSGVFPRSCVEVRELLGEADEPDADDTDTDSGGDAPAAPAGGGEEAEGEPGKNGLTTHAERKRRREKEKERQGGDSGDRDANRAVEGRKPLRELPNGTAGLLAVPVKRDPNAPRPAAPVPMLKIGDETPTSAAEPLIDEIASCLREWHSTNLHGLLLSRQYQRLDRLAQLIGQLNLGRQQLLHGVLTTAETGRLRERAVWDLVRVNKLCGGEVIVRDPRERGRVLVGDDSVVEITRLQSVMSLLDEPPQAPVEATALHHLLVDVRGFAGASSDGASLEVYLVGRPVGGTAILLSEAFAVDMPSGGVIGAAASDGEQPTRTLFADLSAQDIGDVPSAESELYLVVKVRASQYIVVGKPGSRSGPSGSEKHQKDPAKPPSAGGNKAVRRSLMWGKAGSRSGFAKAPVNKLDALSEQPEEAPATNGLESRDGPVPPATAGSKGRTSVDGSQTTTTVTAQRTVGVGVLKLNTVMKQDEEVEQVLTVWSPSARLGSEKQELNDEWESLVRELLESKTGHYEKSRRAERVQLHLRAFNHPDADALIRATPTLLSGVAKTNKMGFSGAPTKPRSDIYLSLESASLTRQNLLSRFGGNPTTLPGSVRGDNLQVTLEVRRSNGERIDGCIFAASNSDGAASWRSTAAERGESWRQTIRLSVPPQEVATAHMVIFMSDLPGPPFAVAHMPLWYRGAFTRDGPHALLLYKLDENTATAQPGPMGKGGYLGLPWSAKGKDEHSAEVTGPLATLRIDTFLCSTRFSQDRVVLGLLKWKDAPRDEIPSLLKQLVFVPEIEVVKLLSDVLDALFGILVEYSGNDEYEDLVFTALVRVLGIVYDRRFNLGPLVDAYAESKFNYPFATPCLVRSFTRLLEKPTEPETSRKLRSTFKVVRHILKFITHARGQQKAKEAGIGITSSTPGFTRHLRTIFKALEAMMRNSAPVLVGSQTLAVQHFHLWLPELAGLLTTEEIMHIAIDFMDSCAQVRGKLALYKLLLIINYARLDIFSHPEQRSVLSANTVRWIAPHWGKAEEVTELWREGVRLCCSVLASQAEHLGPEIPDYVPKVIDSYLAIRDAAAAGDEPPRPKKRLSLLFPTAYPFPTRPVAQEVLFDEALIELSAVLSALSGAPGGMQLELVEEDLTSLIEGALRVHASVLAGEAFPADWLSVHIYHHKSAMRTLQYLSGIMLEQFLPHPDDAESFNTELWKMFFTTLLRLVGSTSLALETFPEQKRRAVWKIAGDVREHGAELLRRTWEAIGWETSADERARYGLAKMGGYQVQYVPTLVGPIVELCLSVHEGLRRMAVEVLQTMIVSEWTLSEDLSVIQTEMIDCLDQFFKTKPLTESILQKLFVAELLGRFEPLADQEEGEALYKAIAELMETVNEFLDLLVAVHSGDTTSEASHLINRLRLMEFLREVQKEEIFVRYVHQLAGLQAGARNHVEAGLALRLHAELYDWDPTRQAPALADPEFPAQSHFDRRERVYFDMIKHFEDGGGWASALAAYQELRAQYEANVFDFAKLARTERAIAGVYETIAKSDRMVPRYFKVTYRGLGFPTALRDKDFIYEGVPTERASAFTDRMQEQYPSAQIVVPGQDVEDLEGQFLAIAAISPHRDLQHHVFQRSRVPQPTRDYLLSSNPQEFSVSTRRVTTGPPEEHYAEKTVYVTEDAFPTILRRSEVVDVREVRLTARETALERVVRKTQEMSGVERRLAAEPADADAAQLLSDAVSVSTNPASENSVAVYRQLVPMAEAEDEEVELTTEDNAIKTALVDHAVMVRRCLMLLAKSPIEGVRTRAEELKGHFEATFAPEIALLLPPPPSDTTRTPSPSWQRSSNLVESPSTQVQQLGRITSVGTEEAMAVAQPATRQGLGARLSFLGGRGKKDDAAAGAQANGDAEGRRSTLAKDPALHRRSFFRGHSSDLPAPSPGPNGHDSTDWVTDSGGRTSTDTGLTEKGAEAVAGSGSGGSGSGAGGERSPGATGRMGSVRKRLSLLKLGGGGGAGKKAAAGAAGAGAAGMGSLDEE